MLAQTNHFFRGGKHTRGVWFSSKNTSLCVNKVFSTTGGERGLTKSLGGGKQPHKSPDQQNKVVVGGKISTNEYVVFQQNTSFFFISLLFLFCVAR